MERLHLSVAYQSCAKSLTHTNRSKFQKVMSEQQQTHASLIHHQTLLQNESGRGNSFWLLSQHCQQCQEFVCFSHKSNASTSLNNKQRREVLSKHRRASRHHIFISPSSFSIMLSFLFQLLPRCLHTSP